MTNLIAPHGGTLCELVVHEDRRSKIQKESLYLPSLTLNDRQLCDIEMLLNGSFSPLIGFLNNEDYDSVVENLTLANGIIWPIPITLDVGIEFSEA